MKNLMLYLLTLMLVVQCGMLWADEAQEHAALRNLRIQVTNAMNNKDLDALAPLFDTNFILITVDNRKFTNLQEFKDYWYTLFHQKDVSITDVKFDPKADNSTQFLTPDVGVVSGTSIDTYHFSDGDISQMATRWTAVVKKNPAGWQISMLHFSANIFDNPVLAAAKRLTYWYGALGLFVGFLLGILVMLIFNHKTT